jgi:hypothetical protein
MPFSDDVRRLEEQMARDPAPRFSSEALDEDERECDEGSGADAEPVSDGGGLGAGADVELGEDA